MTSQVILGVNTTTLPFCLSIEVAIVAPGPPLLSSYRSSSHMLVRTPHDQLGKSKGAKEKEQQEEKGRLPRGKWEWSEKEQKRGNKQKWPKEKSKRSLSKAEESTLRKKGKQREERVDGTAKKFLCFLSSSAFVPGIFFFRICFLLNSASFPSKCYTRLSSKTLFSWAPMERACGTFPASQR